MKKLILGIGLLFSAFAARSQGLDSVIIERYYISDAADAAGSVGALPVGSVTYRVYVDMAPGYKFQAIYGVPGHDLKYTSTTSFFNNEDRGAITPNGISASFLDDNTVMLDSWISVGAAGNGRMGVLKSEDPNGSILVLSSLYNNTDPLIGISPKTQDGIMVATPEAVTTVGITNELDIFDAFSLIGNSFVVNNASLASLNGSAGPTATNRVLVGQFTTDGKFRWELNIQLQRISDAAVFNYVAQNPTGSELTHPSLMGAMGANTLPTVSITSPANGANFVVNDPVVVDATASDADGTVSSVQFYVDGNSIGTDNSSPYQATWPSATPIGSHTLTAVATDNESGQTTSSAIVINVLANPPPSVSITAPANGASYIVSDVVAISASASDNGSVDSVEFFVDAVKISVDLTSPYNANWTSTLGGHTLTARATDNQGAQTTSAPISISVVNNIPPSCSITAPVNGSSVTAPTVVMIAVNASDADGTVDSVEFFVNAAKVGSDLTSPYAFNWTSVIGTAVITARATDDRGSVTISLAVTINVEDPNALPYRIVTTKNTCLPDTFCLPLMAYDTVANVIGYDIVFNYDTTKVYPTGVVTESSDLVSSAFTDVINSIDPVNGLMNISSFFNASAPPGTFYQGTGILFCVEFVKKPAFQPIDTAFFSVSDLQESYFTGVSTKLVNDGNYNTYKDSLFHAQLLFWLDSTAIKYNAANPNQYLITNIFGTDTNCTDSSAVNVQPDTLGFFTHSIWQGESVQIERDVLGVTDVQPVVNGFDAVLTRRVLVNDITFTPNAYQIVAMDVNTDGKVSAGDVSQINQRTVMLIPEFKQAWNHDIFGNSDGRPSKDWLFLDDPSLASAPYQISGTYPADDGTGFSKYRVPVVDFCLPVPVSSYTFCPLIDSAAFTGVMLGDVNGNYAAIAPDGAIKKETAIGTVMFDLANITTSGIYVDVPVSIASSTEAVYALDFALKYNDQNLVFQSIIDHTGTIQALSHYNTGDKTVRFTSSSLVDYMKKQTLVSIRFSLLGKAMNGSDLSSITSYLNGDRAKVATEVNAGSINTVIVYPNPASGVLYVESAQQATIQLMDLSGRQVVMESQVNADEKQAVNVSNIVSGIYLLKVYNGSSVSIRKVVINR